jgi:hypothetical protein
LGDGAIFGVLGDGAIFGVLGDAGEGIVCVYTDSLKRTGVLRVSHRYETAMSNRDARGVPPESARSAAATESIVGRTHV